MVATYKNGGRTSISTRRLVFRVSDISRIANLRHVRISHVSRRVIDNKGGCGLFVRHTPDSSLPSIGDSLKVFTSGHVVIEVSHRGKDQIFTGAFAGRDFSKFMDTSRLHRFVLRNIMFSRRGAHRKGGVVLTTDIDCPRASLCVPFSVAVAPRKGVDVSGGRSVRRLPPVLKSDLGWVWGAKVVFHIVVFLNN